MQVIEPAKAGFSPEVAQALLELHFNADAIQHINDLTDKNRQECAEAVKDDCQAYPARLWRLLYAAFDSRDKGVARLK